MDIAWKALKVPAASPVACTLTGMGRTDTSIADFHYEYDGSAERAGLTLAEIRSILALRDDGHAPAPTSPA
ncbi:hypothetical protein [Streptomyces sp. NBC_00059]|uniref:hypothetical protein n=1 Tax=Streptomyces sp. NBC_00059 TaxID=2975635 RepID=UPI00225632CD|nr:hypothetical protein [Streptomyces sp. NBC_00059]MCX5417639.1 hypothetical protein [Streptomyces sp. NBC_00059]